jgi:hypothetical protein
MFWLSALPLSGCDLGKGFTKSAEVELFSGGWGNVARDSAG